MADRRTSLVVGEGPAWRAKADHDQHPRFTPADAISLTERTRVYDFGDKQIQLDDVRELIARNSGTHRVRTADGKLHVIAPGWLAIHIDNGGKDWTV